MKTRKRRGFPRLALALLAIAALALLSSCSGSSQSLKNPEIGSLRDGSYTGSYFIFPVKVRVKVQIASGRIVSIDLLQHFNGQGKAAEALLPRVVETQSIELEAISGATHSSKTILNAIGEALNKARG